jgi:hypothetical protein
MSRLKKILIGILVVLLLLAGSVLLFIGPWPTYKDSNFRTSSYYKAAIEALEKNAAESNLTEAPGPLQAGWAVRIMTPKVGTPLGGYGDRKGKPSTGVHDDLYVKALALSDGTDTVVLVGSDMLLVPPNVADLVREQVAAATPLTANDLYFTASHTHCGPGAWAPGVAGYVTGGKYDPTLPGFLAECFAGAIIDAYQRLEPAKLAVGGVDAPEFIRNRTRKAEIDTGLDFMLVEQADGDRCYLVRYSAHPTNYGGSMMEFSAEFPGELQRVIERSTRATAIYMGGALGSSGPRAPEGPNPTARIEAMGQALAQRVLASSAGLPFSDHLDIASVGTAVGMASLQLRPVSAKWRLSPLIGKVFGVPPIGWVHAVRIGQTVLIGMPFDFSSEVSRDWKAWASTQGYNAWPTSFSAAYCGYLSPDKYYLEEPLDYETGLMSWFGPNMEAYFTELFHHAVEVITPPVKQAAVAP